MKSKITFILLNDKINYEILSLLKQNKYLTIDELAAKISKTPLTIYRHMSSLMSGGYVERVGSREKGYWDVKI